MAEEKTGAQMVEWLAEINSELDVLSPWHVQARHACGWRAWWQLTALTPSYLEGQRPVGSSRPFRPGNRVRGGGGGGEFYYLGSVLLLALGACHFDRVGDWGHPIQVLQGQRPSHCQEDDVVALRGTT